MESSQWKQGQCTDPGDIPQIQDKLTGALIGLARATEGNDHMVTDSTAAVTVEGLSATLPGGNFSPDALLAILEQVDGEKRKLVPDCYHCACSCGRTDNFDMNKLRDADEEVRSLKSRILTVSRDIAVHLCCAAVPGFGGISIHQLLYKALFSIGMEDWGKEELLPILQELERAPL